MNIHAKQLTNNSLLYNSFISLLYLTFYSILHCTHTTLTTTAIVWFIYIRIHTYNKNKWVFDITALPTKRFFARVAQFVSPLSSLVNLAVVGTLARKKLLQQRGKEEKFSLLQYIFTSAHSPVSPYIPHSW